MKATSGATLCACGRAYSVTSRPILRDLKSNVKPLARTMQLFEIPFRISLDEFDGVLALQVPVLPREGEFMVEGILVVNLDPPYVGFVQKNDKSKLKGKLKNCTVPELRQMLLDLGAISPQQQWPPKDCTIRLPGKYSSAALEKIGLETKTSVVSS